MQFRPVIEHIVIANVYKYFAKKKKDCGMSNFML